MMQEFGNYSHNFSWNSFGRKIQMCVLQISLNIAPSPAFLDLASYFRKWGGENHLNCTVNNWIEKSI